MSNLDYSKLKTLPPGARARVDAALKAALDAELTYQAGSRVSERMLFSRSRFVGFSRSTSSDSLRAIHAEFEERILDNLESMDDESFTRLAKRLSILKDINKR